MSQKTPCDEKYIAFCIGGEYDKASKQDVRGRLLIENENVDAGVLADVTVVYYIIGKLQKILKAYIYGRCLQGTVATGTENESCRQHKVVFKAAADSNIIRKLYFRNVISAIRCRWNWTYYL